MWASPSLRRSSLHSRVKKLEKHTKTRKKKDTCEEGPLFISHAWDMTPVLSFVFTLCVVCVCARFTFVCSSYNCHKESVVVRKSNLCKHMSWWWVASLSLCGKKSSSILAVFFFFFSLLVPRRGHDKGADACEDTFHLTACIRWAIPYLYPGATLIMQSHQGILRFTRKCHAIADKVKWQFWSVQGWVYKWSKDVSLSI